MYDACISKEHSKFFEKISNRHFNVLFDLLRNNVLEHSVIEILD